MLVEKLEGLGRSGAETAILVEFMNESRLDYLGLLARDGRRSTQCCPIGSTRPIRSWCRFGLASIPTGTVGISIRRCPSFFRFWTARARRAH